MAEPYCPTCRNHGLSAAAEPARLVAGPDLLYWRYFVSDVVDELDLSAILTAV